MTENPKIEICECKDKKWEKHSWNKWSEICFSMQERYCVNCGFAQIRQL